jgi:UDP-3-O-[3-hydroxymyristoyl] glucosamine N-acyltransferase
VRGLSEADGDLKISGAAPFEMASSQDITFAGDPKFLKRLGESPAGAVLVPKDFLPLDKKQMPALIRVEHPMLAFAEVVRLFYPPEVRKKGISPLAFVGEGVVLGADVSISPFAVIENRANIGDRARIHPHVVIGEEVKIGDDVLIYPNVTILRKCRIGNRVVIHAGSVIGSDGFGFSRQEGTFQKVAHSGIVEIGDDVEIGANNTIDRGTFGITRIEKGVKTDNLVHIAHNVTVGENSALVAQVGISGSTTLGRNVILAGQAGISGHLTIGDGAIVGPQAGVAKSVPPGEIVSGTPEMPHRLWLRVQNIIQKLPALKKQVTDIEERLQRIENG